MKFVAVLFVLCSLALILIVLMQKGKGGGLSAAFGGGAASGLLGSKTGDFLTWVTIVLAGLFLGLAVVMARFYKPTVSDFDTGVPARQEQPLPAEQEPDLAEPFETGEAGGVVPDANIGPGLTDVNDAAGVTDTNLPGG